MKSSIRHFLFSLLVSLPFISCSGPKSVKLQDPPAPAAPAPNLGPSKPQPTPAGPESDPTEPPVEGTPQPPPPSSPRGKVARIFCESQPGGGRSLNTLRADVVSNYTMPSITLFVNGSPISQVKAPVPLQSTNEKAFLILRAQEDFTLPWKIYKTTVDMYSTQGELQLLSTYERPSKSAQFVYEMLKLENRFLAANAKRTAYVYPNNNGVYVWENLKGSKFSLPFNAETSYSPEFVGGDDYLRFDQLAEGGLALTQRFYHFDSKKTLVLPPPLTSKDSQILGSLDAQRSTLYWLEGRPDSAWKWRSVALKPGAKPRTVVTLPGNPRSLILPMVTFNPSGDETVLAYLEEDVSHERNGQAYYKTAALHLLTASARSGDLTGNRTISYTEDMKNLVRTEQDYGQGLMRNLFLEPLSGRLYASNIPKGGLISFNPRTSSWEIHAMIGNVFGCLNPQWGVEVSRD